MDERERAFLQGLKGDFRNFLWYVWQHISLPDPTDVQYDIADYLQHGPQRMIIEGFRGMGKSFVTSAFACWCWLNDPSLKIMVVSGSKDRADSFSIFTKRLLAELPVLQRLDPEKGEGRVRNDAFDLAGVGIDHSPSCKSVGITGQLTGSRADIIIADDVETPKNSLTELMRERLETLVTEFEAILKPVPHARVIFLGTPQTEESLYNKLVQKGYDLRVWPARVPTAEQAEGYRGFLARMILDMMGSRPAGTTTDPKRFTNEDLKAREASYGRSGFALQFMLDTTLSDAERYPLRLGDLIVTDVNPQLAPAQIVWGGGPDQVLEGLPNVGFKGDRYHAPMHVTKDQWQPYDERVLFVDPSGRGADETGWAVLGVSGGRIYTLDAGGLKGGYDEKTLGALAWMARNHEVSRVVYESNFGDGMWGELFKPVLRKVYACTVEEVRVSGQKELRIVDTLEPVLNQHRLVVDRKLIERDAKAERENQLFYQLTHITRDRGCLRHDDRLDALYLGVSWFIQQFNVTEDEALEAHQEAEMDRELQEFYDHVSYEGDMVFEPGGADESWGSFY